MKKTISITVSLATMLVVFPVLAQMTGVAPTATPSISAGSTMAARKVCEANFQKARNTYHDAVQKARIDFLTANRSARNVWKSSDKGKAAKQSFQSARKATQDSFAAAKKAARTAWVGSIATHNQCTINNPTSTPPPIIVCRYACREGYSCVSGECVPTATPAATVSPSTSVSASPTATPTAIPNPIATPTSVTTSSGWQCTSGNGTAINNICYADQQSCAYNCPLVGPTAGCRQTTCQP